MNKYTFTDSSSRYDRISKHVAYIRFTWDKSIILCPVKLSPGSPFTPHIELHKQSFDQWREHGGDDKTSFDMMINNFCYYNCQFNETGYYSAFYVRTDI
jgi:hypothetical protein